MSYDLVSAKHDMVLIAYSLQKTDQKWHEDNTDIMLIIYFTLQANEHCNIKPVPWLQIGPTSQHYKVGNNWKNKKCFLIQKNTDMIFSAILTSFSHSFLFENSTLLRIC